MSRLKWKKQQHCDVCWTHFQNGEREQEEAKKEGQNWPQEATKLHFGEKRCRSIL